MTGTENESRHYCEAEKWLRMAEGAYADGVDLDVITVLQRFAEVHASLAAAADIDREADAEARIASCVPNGSEALAVSVRGR